MSFILLRHCVRCFCQTSHPLAYLALGTNARTGLLGGWGFYYNQNYFLQLAWAKMANGTFWVWLICYNLLRQVYANRITDVMQHAKVCKFVFYFCMRQVVAWNVHPRHFGYIHPHMCEKGELFPKPKDSLRTHDPNRRTKVILAKGKGVLHQRHEGWSRNSFCFRSCVYWFICEGIWSGWARCVCSGH